MKFAVLQFPGSNCDQDCLHVVRGVMGHTGGYVWHKETSLGDADAVIVPGGFSYGDYLRSGAIAKTSPVMAAVREFADKGGLVLGICNGFQILTESGLLPGALVRNRDLTFICEQVWLKVENSGSAFTRSMANMNASRFCMLLPVSMSPQPIPSALWISETNTILRSLGEGFFM